MPPYRASVHKLIATWTLSSSTTVPLTILGEGPRVDRTRAAPAFDQPGQFGGRGGPESRRCRSERRIFGVHHSDDLWAPHNIEAQIACMLDFTDASASSTAGTLTSTVTTVSCRSSSANSGRLGAQGNADHEFCRQRELGLFRRAAFARGRLRRNPLFDGCEDLAICLRMAEHFEFRVVKRHLVGYRILPDSKSSNAMKMRRACEAVLSEYRQPYPEFSREIQTHLDQRSFWLLVAQPPWEFTALATNCSRFCASPIRVLCYHIYRLSLFWWPVPALLAS